MWNACETLPTVSLQSSFFPPGWFPIQKFSIAFRIAKVLLADTAEVLKQCLSWFSLSSSFTSYTKIIELSWLEKTFKIWWASVRTASLGHFISCTDTFWAEKKNICWFWYIPLYFLIPHLKQEKICIDLHSDFNKCQYLTNTIFINYLFPTAITKLLKKIIVFNSKIYNREQGNFEHYDWCHRQRFVQVDCGICFEKPGLLEADGVHFQRRRASLVIGLPSRWRGL